MARLHFAALLAAALCASRPAAAQPGNPQGTTTDTTAAEPRGAATGTPVFLASKPLVLSSAEFPYRLVLRNRTAAQRQVYLSFHAVDGGQRFIVPDSTPVTLDTAGTTVVDLRLGDATGAAWPRRGYLAAREGTTLLDTLDVTLYPRSVPLASLPVAGWTTEVRRWTLLPEAQKCAPVPHWYDHVIGTCVRAAVVPVGLAAGAGDGPARGTPLGFLANDTLWTGTALVVSGGRDSVAGALPGERIELRSLGDVGKYEGRIPLGRVNSVQLKVLVTHGLLPAMLAILAGVLLAWRLQRYTSRDRLALVTERRILGIAESAREAQARFGEELGVHAIGTSYSIRASVTRTRDELLERLDQLVSDHALLGAENADLAALLAAAGEFRARVTAWPTVGAALGRLAVQLNRLEAGIDASERPGSVANPLPRVVRDRDTLLAGGPVALAEVESERAGLEARARMAAGWRTLNAAAAAADRAARRLPAGTDGDAVRGEAAAVWAGLWDGALDDLPGLRARLQAAQAEIQRLGGPAAVPLPEFDPPPQAPTAAPAPAGAGMRAMAQGAVGAVWDAVGGPLLWRRAGRPVPSAEAVHRRVRTLDRSLSIVATGVAVLVALDQVYYDGPVFGTLRDYLSAFIWAFGVRAGYELLRQVAEAGLVRLPVFKG